MTAIEYIKRVDWKHKFDLTRAIVHGEYNDQFAWSLTPWKNIKASTVTFSKYGFTFRYGPLKDYSRIENSVDIHFNPEYTYCKVRIGEIIYVSENLSRNDREWLEDWARVMSEDIYDAKEEFALSFIDKPKDQ